MTLSLWKRQYCIFVFLYQYDADHIDAKKPGPLARYRVVRRMAPQGADLDFYQAPTLASAWLKVALGRITALTLALSGL
jgi:hypothetical protein